MLPPLCDDPAVPRRVRYAEHPDAFCEVHGDSERRALVVHGGFWRDRYDLTLMDGLCVDLAARGWEAWNVEYRRLGRESHWPEMAADVLAAAELAQAEVAIGHSAGGHIALWLAAEGAVPAAVGQAPVSDLVAAAPLSGGVVAELGAPPEASPLARLPLGARQLLVHGDRDENVPVQMSRAYVEAARAAGDDVSYSERAGEGHFEHIDPGSGAWEDVIAWL
jgi:acetyl esterase/lipase